MATVHKATSGLNVVLYATQYTDASLVKEPYIAAFPSGRSQRHLRAVLERLDGTPGKRVVIVSGSPISLPERELALTMLNATHAERERIVWLCPESAMPTKEFVKSDATWATLQSYAQEAHAQNLPITVRSFCADDWTDGVAAQLGARMFESPPAITAQFGGKFEAKHIFDSVEITTPAWSKTLCRTVEEINAAVTALIASNPSATKLMLKLSDSGWAGGLGNAIIDVAEFKKTGNICAEGVLKSAITWKELEEDLGRSGAIIEVMVPDVIGTPSIQCEIRLNGTVKILSTHEQIVDDLGSYIGCRFPADAAHPGASAIRTQMLEQTRHVAEAMQAQGYHGTFGIDFVADRSQKVWALEINARVTGTCHAIGWAKMVLRTKVSQEDGLLRGSDGEPRFYHNQRIFGWADYQRLSIDDISENLKGAGLLWDPAKGTGCVPGLVGGLSLCGFMELTAIAKNTEEATAMFTNAKLALDTAAAHKK